MNNENENEFEFNFEVASPEDEFDVIFRHVEAFMGYKKIIKKELHNIISVLLRILDIEINFKQHNFGFEKFVVKPLEYVNRSVELSKFLYTLAHMNTDFGKYFLPVKEFERLDKKTNVESRNREIIHKVYRHRFAKRKHEKNDPPHSQAGSSSGFNRSKQKELYNEIFVSASNTPITLGILNVDELEYIQKKRKIQTLGQKVYEYCAFLRPIIFKLLNKFKVRLRDSPFIDIINRQEQSYLEINNFMRMINNVVKMEDRIFQSDPKEIIIIYESILASIFNFKYHLIDRDVYDYNIKMIKIQMQSQSLSLDDKKETLNRHIGYINEYHQIYTILYDTNNIQKFLLIDRPDSVTISDSSYIKLLSSADYYKINDNIIYILKYIYKIYGELDSSFNIKLICLNEKCTENFIGNNFDIVVDFYHIQILELLPNHIYFFKLYERLVQSFNEIILHDYTEVKNYLAFIEKQNYYETVSQSRNVKIGLIKTILSELKNKLSETEFTFFDLLDLRLTTVYKNILNMCVYFNINIDKLDPEGIFRDDSNIDDSINSIKYKKNLQKLLENFGRLIPSADMKYLVDRISKVNEIMQNSDAQDHAIIEMSTLEYDMIYYLNLMVHLEEKFMYSVDFFKHFAKTPMLVTKDELPFNNMSAKYVSLSMKNRPEITNRSNLLLAHNFFNLITISATIDYFKNSSITEKLLNSEETINLEEYELYLEVIENIEILIHDIMEINKRRNPTNKVNDAFDIDIESQMLYFIKNYPILFFNCKIIENSNMYLGPDNLNVNVSKFYRIENKKNQLESANQGLSSANQGPSSANQGPSSANQGASSANQGAALVSSLLDSKIENINKMILRNIQKLELEKLDEYIKFINENKNLHGILNRNPQLKKRFNQKKRLFEIYRNKEKK